MEAQRLRGYLRAGNRIDRAIASRSWSEAEARAVLEEIEASKLSIAAFCRRYGLCRQRLDYWKRRLSDGDRRGNAVLVPVRVVGTPLSTRSEPIEIDVRGERTVRVRAGFDRELLRQVLDVLEC